MHTEPLDVVPLWGLVLIESALLGLVLEIGYRIGKWRHEYRPDEREQPVGAMVASILGLVALVLGFTFSLAANRFDARRLVVLEESNAIGTTYLRARLLPEPQATETARLLRKYVDIRVRGVQDKKIDELIAKSEALHELLWTQATAAAEKNPTSIMTGIFIQSLNDVIDLHAKRLLLGIRSRIPIVIWIGVFGLSLLSMWAVGYQAALTTTRRSPAMFGLVLTFAIVLLLITDLDRGHEGLLKVSQQSMLDLQRSMQPCRPRLAIESVSHSVDLVTVTRLLTSLGLVATMLANGLKVHLAEILAAARQIRLVVLALVANFLLVPAATASLLYLFNPEPMIAAGFLILAVCPGAPFGPLFATFAKGDIPSAIGLMVILAGLSAILSPLLLAALLNQMLSNCELHVSPLSIVQTLVVTQILPLVIGVAIYETMPSLAAWTAKPLSRIANFLLLSVVVLLLVAQFPTLAQIHLRGWFGMLILLAASLAIGWLCGGPALATRKTLAVTTSSRNAAVALVIVANSFAGTPAATAVVAFALLSIFGTLGCAFALRMWPPAPSLS